MRMGRVVCEDGEGGVRGWGGCGVRMGRVWCEGGEGVAQRWGE